MFMSQIFGRLISPRVHLFLWLLAKNKVLTMDNLAIRQEVADKSCLFCAEQETSRHLFFDCEVAKKNVELHF